MKRRIFTILILATTLLQGLYGFNYLECKGSVYKNWYVTTADGSKTKCPYIAFQTMPYNKGISYIIVDNSSGTSKSVFEYNDKLRLKGTINLQHVNIAIKADINPQQFKRWTVKYTYSYQVSVKETNNSQSDWKTIGSAVIGTKSFTEDTPSIPDTLYTLREKIVNTSVTIDASGLDISGLKVNTKYDVIVGKDNPLLDWKTITKGGRVTKPTITNPRRTPYYMEEPNQAPTKLFELYRHYPGIGYRNVTHGFPTIPITGLNTTAEQMKCGGRRKAQLGLDIREGGIAIPIAPNMYYMDGRSHDEGGIAIGPNNKNGVEVEGGEVVEMIDSKHPSVGRQFKAGGQQQTMRVFSSVPFLRGASPAELVLGGANPDAVFKAQEEFKDRNRINDDGTTYEMGGERKSKSKRSRPVTGVLPYGYTIRNLYAVENPYRKGIKGNVAKMYDSRTLGAGVDVVSGHPELYKKAKSGKMTKKQADETAVIHLRKDDNAIRSNYADVYGKAAADTLSYGPRFLVAQARYQQGNVRKAWPPIHKAMAKGDAKALKKAVLQVTPKDHTYRRKWIEDNVKFTLEDSFVEGSAN